MSEQYRHVLQCSQCRCGGRMYRSWNPVFVSVLLLFATPLCTGQVDGDDAATVVMGPKPSPKQGAQTLITPKAEEGRAFFNLGIFDRISQFFGWGPPNRKSSRESLVLRRPELVPFELSSENKRKSFGLPQITHSLRKNYKPTSLKWLSNELTKPPLSPKQTYPFYQRTPPYNPDSAAGIFSLGNNLAENAMKLDRAGKRDYLFSKETQKVSPNNGIAKVESREPIVTIYTGGEKQELHQIQKSKHSHPVHSKFALEYYSPKSNPDNPYPKEPYYTQHNTRTKPELVQQYPKYNKQTSNKKNSAGRVRPYVYGNTNSLYKSPVSGFLETTHHSWDNPYPDGKEKKEKGFFDNVSRFASNIFDKLIPPKSSFPARFKRRHRNNLPLETPFNSRHDPASTSFPPPPSEKRRDDKDSYFNPSPQQGIIAEDVFQPIFVPSYSMDEDLPKDAMKPMILPEKRKIEVAPEGPTEPEMIDFF